MMFAARSRDKVRSTGSIGGLTGASHPTATQATRVDMDIAHMRNTYSRNSMKCFVLYIPMQLFIQGQWWSILKTQ